MENKMVTETQNPNGNTIERQLEGLLGASFKFKILSEERILTETTEIVAATRQYEGATYKHLFKKLGLSYTGAAKTTDISRSTISRFLKGNPITRVGVIRYALQQYLAAYGKLDDHELQMAEKWLIDTYKQTCGLYIGVGRFEGESGPSWKDEATKKVQYAEQTVKAVYESIQKISLAYDPDNRKLKVLTLCDECASEFIGFESVPTPHLCPDCESYQQRQNDLTLHNVRVFDPVSLEKDILEAISKPYADKTQ